MFWAFRHRKVLKGAQTILKGIEVGRLETPEWNIIEEEKARLMGRSPIGNTPYIGVRGRWKF